MALNNNTIVVLRRQDELNDVRCICVIIQIIIVECKEFCIQQHLNICMCSVYNSVYNSVLMCVYPCAHVCQCMPCI